MEGFDPRTSFGEDVARRYDDDVRGDEDDTVLFLEAYASDGRALEFAIGTGRIALPLSQAGVSVDGIELSEAMIQRLRARPGGTQIDITLGDMSIADAPGTGYALVYLVYNTIYNILTQDGQVQCFENAARHLSDDGVFVVEAGTPDAWIRGEDFVKVEHLRTNEVVLDFNRYDAVTQILDENHVSLSGNGIRFGPISCRLIHPSEMDLMARIAGLQLVVRWGGWKGEPFTASSGRHVSVYAKKSY